MEQSSQPSRRTLLIGIGAAMGLIFIISLAAYAIFGSTRREEPSGVSETSQEPVASKEEVSQNIKDTKSLIKQANTDQAAAKAAINDDKRIRVTN